MGFTEHRFPPQQAVFLQAWTEGTYSAGFRGTGSVSLIDRLPPIYPATLQGACVASAVTALLEYYRDLHMRLSVQYLHAATRAFEREGLERNLAHLRAGEPLDGEFERAYHAKLQPLVLMAERNGGMKAPNMRLFLEKFERDARAWSLTAEGCLLRSCFHVVETRGVCRYALWPSASATAAPVLDGLDAPAFPPGTHEDAEQRRVTHGLYLLPTPNNVDEIRGILAGTNNRRPMPVVVTVDFFEGCDGETYSLPGVKTDPAGNLVSAARWQGRHGLLVVGYRDDAKFPGGGYFEIRNSLGEAWGDHGYGKLPYAYLTCFALEAGTILQDRLDYEGDGYGGSRAAAVPPAKRASHRGRNLALNLLLAAALVGGTIAIGAFFHDPLHLHTPKPKPESGTTSGETLRSYKVFLSCADAAERKALREALANEGVPFAVEFMPPTLESVLALRVTLPEGDAYGMLAKELKAHYEGPRKAFWTDVSGLVRTRAIYIVAGSARRREEVE